MYPDLASTLSLLFHGNHTQQASRLLREVEVLQLSVIHRLQIENGLVRSLRDPARADKSKKALRLWRQYLDEEVFRIESFDVETAFVEAALWNATTSDADTPPKWSVLIHAAVAVTIGATFFSLDPVLRKIARKHGTKVFPPEGM